MFIQCFASYGALTGGICALAWLSTRLEAVPTVQLRPWDLNAEPLVVIDAGHGGHDGGAVAGGAIEKNLTLELALRLRDELTAKGIRVKMTRDTDVFLPLEERAAIANKMEAAAFVSLHLNTSAAPEVDGIETYFTEQKPLSVQRALQAKWAMPTAAIKDQRGRWLAESLQQHVCKITHASDRGIKQRNYVVVSQTQVPSALIECGFLTHETEAGKLKKEDYQKLLISGISDGVIQFLKAQQSQPKRGLSSLNNPADVPAEETEVTAP